MNTYLNPEFVKYVTNPIKIIVEAGSRDGLDSIELFNHYKPQKIFAFEPNPDSISICRKNIKDYEKNIELIERALWKHTGEIEFMPVDIIKSKSKNIGASSCFKWNPRLYQKVFDSEEIVQNTISISAASIDDFFVYGPNIDMLCMDVQGSELMILEGATNTLKNIKYIITEVSLKPQYEGACKQEEVVCFLEKHGFILKYDDGEDILDRVFSDAIFVRKNIE